MDFGLVGLDNFSISNNNGSENGSEANNKQKWCGSGFLKQGRVIHEDDYLRDFKLAKNNNMLSFSSPNSQSTMALPFYQHTSTAFGRNTGMYGMISGLRAGPFTASQWMELEHQALIYKYIDANVPIPSYLLNPIRKALESAGFLGLRPNALWGGFQLGFSSNCDPEPGRCRRTDGKKWRCSRDAVVDQKYCERHMNRGRHRSRKPVEGQPGHSVTGITNTAVKPSPTLASVVPTGGLSYRQLDDIPTSNRNIQEKDKVDGVYQHTTVLSRNSSPRISLNDNPLYSIPKHQNDSTCSEFGLVCSDSLLNPLDRRSSLVNHNPSENLNEMRSQHSLRQFIDEDLPRNLSEPPSGIPWLHTSMQQQNRTQLSIAIPSDFMGLGIVSDQTQKQTISWESSMGGPLGEVLHPTTNELNLMDNNSSRLVTSPTGVLQSCAFRSVSSSAGNSPRG